MNPTSFPPPGTPLPFPMVGFQPYLELPTFRVLFGNTCCSPSIINDPRVVAALGYAVPIIWPPPRF